jgi:hypothetical protein
LPVFNQGWRITERGTSAVTTHVWASRPATAVTLPRFPAIRRTRATCRTYRIDRTHWSIADAGVPVPKARLTCDSAGQRLNGHRRYRLHIPADPPVQLRARRLSQAGSAADDDQLLKASAIVPRSASFDGRLPATVEIWEVGCVDRPDQGAVLRPRIDRRQLGAGIAYVVRLT